MKSNQHQLHILSILFVFGIMAFLQSCDYVDSPYSSFTPPPVSNRKVLLEDFTGHTCVYCPRAARKAHELEELYGSQLVVISMHGGDFSYTEIHPDSSFAYDFTTPEGNQLNQDLGPLTSWPNGTVNRKIVNSSMVLAYSAWGGVVSDILQNPPQATIEITNGFNASSRTINTSVKSSFIDELPDSYSLAVYLTEDSIINWQKDIDAIPVEVKNYVHRHVMRGSFNGTYGEQIIAAPDSGATVTKDYALTIPLEYNENHCSIVAFVFNTATKEVVQVEEKKLIP